MALSGKTTNLKVLHALAPSGGAGRLMSLATQDDRTLFFDLLPIRFQTDSGFFLKIKVFTVPGQVIHQSTRRLVLSGADAVAFIADSQIQCTSSNKVAFADLQSNLEACDLPSDLPMVVQFNKQDMDNVRTKAEIEAFGRRVNSAVLPATAIHGLGVRETFQVLLEQSFDHLEAKYGISTKLGLGRDRFLKRLFDGWNTPSNGIGMSK